MIAWILAAMLLLAPGRDHAALAAAIDRVVAAEPPLFDQDANKRKTAALLVAVAFRESAFRNDVVSKTNDHCSYQIHARPELAKDVDACVRVGFAMLRESMRACGAANPLGIYAAGSCSSEHGKRISRDRLALARHIIASVP